MGPSTEFETYVNISDDERVRVEFMKNHFTRQHEIVQTRQMRFRCIKYGVTCWLAVEEITTCGIGGTPLDVSNTTTQRVATPYQDYDPDELQRHLEKQLEE